MDQMWDSWVKFSALQHVGMEELQACPIHFDFSRVLSNIVAPLKSGAADRESTRNIRQALVELRRTAVLLQSIIIDATCQEEETTVVAAQRSRTTVRLSNTQRPILAHPEH